MPSRLSIRRSGVFSDLTPAQQLLLGDLQETRESRRRASRPATILRQCRKSSHRSASSPASANRARERLVGVGVQRALLIAAHLVLMQQVTNLSERDFAIDPQVSRKSVWVDVLERLLGFPKPAVFGFERRRRVIAQRTVDILKRRVEPGAAKIGIDRRVSPQELDDVCVVNLLERRCLRCCSSFVESSSSCTPPSRRSMYKPKPFSSCHLMFNGPHLDNTSDFFSVSRSNA